MNMSNAVVEAIYSMNPPGRFLKKCPSSGQWKDLSKRDAADRVAQAMLYAVSGRDKSKRRRRAQRISRSNAKRLSLEMKPSSTDQPAHHNIPQHATNNHDSDTSNATSRAAQCVASQTQTALLENSSLGPSNDAQTAMVGGNPTPDNAQQPLQQSSDTSPLLAPSIDPNPNPNGLALLLALISQQQHYQQNPFGALIQPALLEVLTRQLLNQIQQHHHQQQIHLLQYILILSQQTSQLAPEQLTSASTLFPLSTQQTNSNHSMELLQQSNALLLGDVLSSLLQHQPNSYAGTSNTPQTLQHSDQSLMSLMPHQNNHNQLPAGSTFGSSSVAPPPSLQMNQLLPQTTLAAQESQQTRQNLQGLQPIAPNDVATTASTNSDIPSNELDRRAENE